MPTTLKPCPFCGGKAKIVYQGMVDLNFVVCDSCSAIVSFKKYEAKYKVTEAWNRRVDNG